MFGTVERRREERGVTSWAKPVGSGKDPGTSQIPALPGPVAQPPKDRGKSSLLMQRPRERLQGKQVPVWAAPVTGT